MQVTYAGQTIATDREGSGLSVAEGSTPDSYVPDGGLLTEYSGAAAVPPSVSFSCRREATSWLDVFEALFGPADLPTIGDLACALSGVVWTLSGAALQQAESSHEGRKVTTSYDFAGASLART